MWTMYIMFAFLTGICYSFVLISSAAGQNPVNLFQVGEVSVYKLHSTVLLNDKNSDKNVGFFLSGDILVHSIWGEENNRLLKFELRAPQLHIRSRKAPSPDGFTQHSSNLESYSLEEFYAIWSAGKIEKILLPKGDSRSLANLKKGIVSLFQLQILDVEVNETDSSGFCRSNYQTIDPTKFQKIKICDSNDLPFVRTSDPIRDVSVDSSRQVTYELDQSLTYISNIYAKETHTMLPSVRDDLASSVYADQILNHVKTEKTQPIRAASLDAAIEQVSSGYKEDTLLTQREELPEEGKTFINLVNELRDHLAVKNLGSIVSGKAFLRLVEAARRAKPDEISKVLSGKKNQKILSQLYDVLGYVQTPEVHFAVMKKLHFDKEDHLDFSERYLWALSMSANPNQDILKDLLERHRRNDNFPEKVKETLILTLAAMARNQEHRKIVRDVEEIIINNLNYAKGEARYIFLRALKNLKSPTTVPVLLDTIKKGTCKEGVLAYKALISFPVQFWTPEVLKISKQTFLQLDRKHDSSSRTLALDILLEAQPSDQTLGDLLNYLKQNDTSVEVKQYLMQRLEMIGDEDQTFSLRVRNLIRRDASLNNYEILSPKGLSTALKRSFMRNSSVNGSLVTIQEILGGIVKRGTVNVIVEKNGITKELFSLGIFAGGLSSFVGGETEGDEETATAGMELTILDTQIRPFVFFNGQGELMGHVWSGTASEKTTAFQSLILLQDHLEFSRLGPGFVAELNLKAGMSFDLSGNIEISIWSRTADSNVEKSAGIITNGLIAIDSDFVRSQIEFSASVEPKLNLKSDIDFSGNMNICMRVTQPDSVFRHNVFKIERIPGSKHKIRIAKYKKNLIPGTTYSLNRKNNEMCSAMFT